MAEKNCENCARDVCGMIPQRGMCSCDFWKPRENGKAKMLREHGGALELRMEKIKGGKLVIDHEANTFKVVPKDEIKTTDHSSEFQLVHHGHWIECDYKHLEHGFMETEPNAGMCCSVCRTAFKKIHMTYKEFCPACGSDMRVAVTNICKDSTFD